MKELPFCQTWYIKGQGFEPRGGACPYDTLLSIPLPSGYIPSFAFHLVKISKVI